MLKLLTVDGQEASGWGNEMNFVHISPHHKRVEEESLFEFAGKLFPESAGLEQGQEAYEKYVSPLLNGLEAHAEDMENLIAFAIIGRYLRPSTGLGRHLPQCSPPWLAFRRLFLKVCDLSIPEELQAAPFQSLAEAFPEFTAEFSKKHGLSAPKKPRKRARVRPAMVSAPVEWRVQRELTKIRLRNYEGVTLDRMKSELVKTGMIDIDEECGALYNVKQNVLWDHVPESLDLSSEMRRRSTLRYLKYVAKKAGIGMDFSADFRNAAESVRGVLFDIAVETTFGGPILQATSSWELEDEFCKRRLVEYPLSIEYDERIRSYVVDGMTREGASFARSIASCFDSAAAKTNINHNLRIRSTLAVHWLNQDFPLWLMTAPAIESFLISSLAARTGGYKNIIQELTKDRSSNPRSRLEAGKTKLIKGLDLVMDSGKIGAVSMTFPKKLESAPGYPKLQIFLSCLPELIERERQSFCEEGDSRIVGNH